MSGHLRFGNRFCSAVFSWIYFPSNRRDIYNRPIILMRCVPAKAACRSFLGASTLLGLDGLYGHSAQPRRNLMRIPAGIDYPVTPLSPINSCAYSHSKTENRLAKPARLCRSVFGRRSQRLSLEIRFKYPLSGELFCANSAAPIQDQLDFGI